MSLDSPNAKAIINRLNQVSGGKILDVGTETGDFIDTLINNLQDYQSFVGIDISKKSIEKAKTRLEKYPVDFQVMNAEALVFEDASFDTVCISHSIHHLRNKDQVLKEMKRVLKPDGYFIIQELLSDNLQHEAQITETMVHHWDAKIDTLLGIPHYKTYTQGKLKELANTLELKELETYHSPHPINCIECSGRSTCMNPKAENIITETIEEIDKNLDRIKDRTDFEELRKESIALKDRVRKHGNFPAAHMFFIGKK
ncbi:MAG: class I SAM-dependent methyltransferase [Candidatus Kariarchaeaceae archaeon]